MKETGKSLRDRKKARKRHIHRILWIPPCSISSRQLAKTLEEIPESILFSNLATLSLTRLNCLTAAAAYGHTSACKFGWHDLWEKD